MNKYNIIAIEPNIEVLRTYKKLFTTNFKGYRDKITFDNAHNNRELDTNFLYNNRQVILIIETAFAEELDHTLNDAPYIDNYRKHINKNLTDKEILRKSLRQGIGIEIAKNIREAKYEYIPWNTPIIFSTWMDTKTANRKILTIQNTWYIQKETIIIDDKSSINIKALYKNIETIIQQI